MISKLITNIKDLLNKYTYLFNKMPDKNDIVTQISEDKYNLFLKNEVNIHKKNSVDIISGDKIIRIHGHFTISIDGEDFSPDKFPLSGFSSDTDKFVSEAKLKEVLLTILTNVTTQLTPITSPITGSAIGGILSSEISKITGYNIGYNNMVVKKSE